MDQGYSSMNGFKHRALHVSNLRYGQRVMDEKDRGSLPKEGRFKDPTFVPPGPGEYIKTMKSPMVKRTYNMKFI